MALAVVSQFAASCSRPPQASVSRIAVLKFENLEGDPALDWVSAAAPGIFAAELLGSSRALVLRGETLRDGYLEGANRLVDGYFEKRGGKLHFEVAIEDAATHKMVAVASADGDPLSAMNAVAAKMSAAVGAKQRPFSTSSDDAASAWGQGDYARAVEIDPDFGEGWLALVEKFAAAGDTPHAMEAAQHALDRSGLHSDLERTRIELLLAELRHDDAARSAALRRLASLTPADPSPLLDLAKFEMAARHFSESAQAYRQAIAAGATGSNLQNSLGYAEGLAGNLDAARKAFETYGREPGESINALDSLGETLFINGKFDDAERTFLEAYAKDPSFLNGATLWKAAHARWLKGDLNGADQLLEGYWRGREKAREPHLVWRRANWLYETGRRDQAEMLLTQVPEADAELARRQAALWRDPSGISTNTAMLKQSYERSEPVNDGLVRTFYAAALLAAGEKDAARALIARWPLPELGDTLAESLLYPQFLELRKVLGT